MKKMLITIHGFNCLQFKLHHSIILLVYIIEHDRDNSLDYQTGDKLH